MEPPGDLSHSIFLSILQPFDFNILLGLLLMLVLLVFSALISGSEVALFSLSPQDRERLDEMSSKSSKQLLVLLESPKTLLATILIGNNLVNVAIIILSSIIMELTFNFEGRELMGFLIQVIAVTLILLIVGEIVPKVYATKNSLKLALIMSVPMAVMFRAFHPVSRILVKSTKLMDKRKDGDGSSQITAQELSQVLELTTDSNTQEDERRILSGIVKFGSTEVRQVMTPRIDVISFPIELNFDELQQRITEHGFSRIPVYEESFDQVKGILYVKDLLKNLDQTTDFKWQELLRPATFVTENKKLDDLLREFQEDKNHLAVVVDEYGGSCGLITLEDIIEEIVGEINDEFDEEELVYSKLDDHNFVFEGKTALMDVYRVIGVEGEELEAEKGESDSLAGLVLELAGRIPLKNEKIKFGNYQFTIEAADKRRVKRIKVTILEP